MSDLIERLRREVARAWLIPSSDTDGIETAVCDLTHLAELAADELTALRTQVSELRADLEVATLMLERCHRHAQNIGIDSGSYFEELTATLNTIRKDG